MSYERRLVVKEGYYIRFAKKKKANVWLSEIVRRLRLRSKLNFFNQESLDTQDHKINTTPLMVKHFIIKHVITFYIELLCLLSWQNCCLMRTWILNNEQFMIDLLWINTLEIVPILSCKCLCMLICRLPGMAAVSARYSWCMCEDRGSDPRWTLPVPS